MIEITTLEAKKEKERIKHLNRNPVIVPLKRFCEEQGMDYKEVLKWCRLPDARTFGGKRIQNVTKRRSNPFPEGWKPHHFVGKWHVVKEQNHER